MIVDDELMTGAQIPELVCAPGEIEETFRDLLYAQFDVICDGEPGGESPG